MMALKPVSTCTCAKMEAHKLPKSSMYPRFYCRSDLPSIPRNMDLTDNPDAFRTDPGMLKKHSALKSYSTADFYYPEIRTFYHPHPQADKLPSKPTPLPLLVFIHGLGGSAAQFAPLLTSLINAAPCLAIDLPGCGLSDFQPMNPEAYKIDALAQLIAEAINQHKDAENGQKVVLIGHSMGCSLATLLSSTTSPLSHVISEHIIGLIAICPRAEPVPASQASRLKLILNWMPVSLFDMYRTYDRIGGLESSSVSRHAGKDADPETKRLQLRFNEQSRSEVFFAMASGLLPENVNGNVSGGLPSKDIWSGLRIPTFLIAGETDHVCPPAHVEKIVQWLGHGTKPSTTEPADGSVLPVAAGEIPSDDSEHHIDVATNSDGAVEGKSSTEVLSESRQPNGPPESSKPHFALKTMVFPAPASHALLYSTSIVRPLSGLIQSFTATHIDHRLSLGWQLQHLTTEGKWDVKNLAKWQAVEPVSEPIGGIFRAMKTLREVDEKHTPKVFVKHFGAKNRVNQGVRMVVDISHESPVYDPKGLEEGGIEYHKFPTVSKLPPTIDEVRAFIALIDSLRTQLAKEGGCNDAVIGVHCHYGFNRTGFFIVCYMIEKLNYRLQDAVDEFANKRAPGIRHEHFVNELYVRYSVGLQRRPTLCE